MKKLTAIAFLGLFLTTFLASCGTSKSHCEAYDGKRFSQAPTETTDIPS